jgi:ankyrin repeat protein
MLVSVIQNAMGPVEAARKGDVQHIKRAAKANPNSLHQPDANGWHPLHEAVRAGFVQVAQVLVLYGADINHKTYTGVSPLDIALEYLGADHAMTKWLQDNGAVKIRNTRTEL